MKTSDLIKKLQNMKRRHGDMEINVIVQTSKYNCVANKIQKIDIMENFSHDKELNIHTNLTGFTHNF